MVELEEVKEKFNHAHAKLRNVIEHAFDVLKARFPILKKMVPYSFDTQRKIVVACMEYRIFFEKCQWMMYDFLTMKIVKLSYKVFIAIKIKRLLLATLQVLILKFHVTTSRLNGKSTILSIRYYYFLILRTIIENF